MSDDLEVRPVRDDDGPQLIELIGAAYAEYPGCVLDLPDLDDDLPVPATTAARRGGRWWVVEDAGRVVATVGTGALDAEGRVELKRLYVAASHRRRGLAARLVARVEAQAAGVGAEEVVLWSDTRFLDAHRLYAGHGYRDTGRRRDLHDPSDTTEIEFVKPLEAPAAAAARSWDGPFGREHVRRVDLPDGVVFHGEVTGVPVGGRPTTLLYSIEVDAAWATRRASVAGAAGRRVLTADGEGRWWVDETPADELTGCLDVDLEASPVTNTLPIRRTGAGAVRAAWLRLSDLSVEPSEQSYEDLGDGRWVYRSAGGFVGDLVVDADGLVVSYARRHDDGATTPVWQPVRHADASPHRL